MARPTGAEAAIDIPPQYQPTDSDFAKLGKAMPVAFAPGSEPARPLAEAAAMPLPGQTDGAPDIYGNDTGAVGAVEAQAAKRETGIRALETKARGDGDEPNALGGVRHNHFATGEGGDKDSAARQRKERDQAYRTALQVLQDQIAMLDQQIAHYERLIEQNNQRIGELNQELNAIEELEALGDNLDPSNPRHAELLRRAGIDPSTVDPDNPQAALERRRREVTDEITRLEQENAQHRQQIDILESEREELEGQLARQVQAEQGLHSQLEATRGDSSPAAAAQRAEAVRSADLRTRTSVRASLTEEEKREIDVASGYTERDIADISGLQTAAFGRSESSSPEVSTGPDSEETPVTPLANMENPFAGGEPVAVAAAETPDQPLAALAGMDNPFAAAVPAVAAEAGAEAPEQPLASVAEMDNPFASPPPEPVAVAEAETSHPASFAGPPEEHPLAQVSALSNPFAQAADPAADDQPGTEVAQIAAADMESRPVSDVLPKATG